MCKHIYTSHPGSIRRMDNSLTTAVRACCLFFVSWLSVFRKPLVDLTISFPHFYLKQVHHDSVNSCTWACTGLNSSLNPSSSGLVTWWKPTDTSFQEMSFCVFCPHTGLLYHGWSLALPYLLSRSSWVLLYRPLSVISPPFSNTLVKKKIQLSLCLRTNHLIFIPLKAMRTTEVWTDLAGGWEFPAQKFPISSLQSNRFL